MRLTVEQLRRVILKEVGPVRGKMRRPGSRAGGKQQYRVGKAEAAPNRELSSFEADQLYPGSVEAWGEIVPGLFPEFPFSDPRVIAAKTAWFKIGDELRVAFEDMPQVELMKWDSELEDWFDIDEPV